MLWHGTGCEQGRETANLLHLNERGQAWRLPLGIQMGVPPGLMGRWSWDGRADAVREQPFVLGADGCLYRRRLQTA